MATVITDFPVILYIMGQQREYQPSFYSLQLVMAHYKQLLTKQLFTC